MLLTHITTRSLLMHLQIVKDLRAASSFTCLHEDVHAVSQHAVLRMKDCMPYQVHKGSCSLFHATNSPTNVQQVESIMLVYRVAALFANLWLQRLG